MVRLSSDPCIGVNLAAIFKLPRKTGARTLSL
jgi:hypothetical protein